VAIIFFSKNKKWRALGRKKKVAEVKFCATFFGSPKNALKVAANGQNT
jgi:hypothetical protein